jgi:hypothetical protein
MSPVQEIFISARQTASSTAIQNSFLQQDIALQKGTEVAVTSCMKNSHKNLALWGASLFLALAVAIGTAIRKL